MTDESEWPPVPRFLVGAIVGSGLGFAGSSLGSVATPWLISISVVSGVVFGLLGVVFGKQLWEVLLP
jgi:hypothetical protein